MDQGRQGRGPALAAAAILVVYGGVAVLVAILEFGSHGVEENPWEAVALLGGFGAFAVLGALLVARRPGHVMGRLFAAIGLLVSIGSAGDAYVSSRVLAGGSLSVVARLAAWPNGWYWYLLLALIFFYVPLLFPDGHLPSPRWRWLAGAVTVAIAVVCVVASLTEYISLQAYDPSGEPYRVVSPLGITGVPDVESTPLFVALSIVLGIGILGAAVSVALRFRRSRGVERQQLKVLLYAVALLPFAVVVEAVPGQVGDVLGSVVFLVALLALPTSIAVAVLRLRLWDVDRLISRTVSYAIVTAVLAGVYALLVLGAEAVAGPDDAPDLVVAGSTLVVAGLFGPVRRSVQRVVNRRFARTSYDAQRTVEQFAGRLRDEVDRTALHRDLVATTRQAVHPSTLSVWWAGAAADTTERPA